MYTLKVARAIRNMTQCKLSEMANINQGKISNFEKGWVDLRTDEKQKIEEVLGMIGLINWNGQAKAGGKK